MPSSLKSESQVEVVVRVTVLSRDGDSKAMAVEMVKKALAHRPPFLTRTTFVSEGDVYAR